MSEAYISARAAGAGVAEGLVELAQMSDQLQLLIGRLVESAGLAQDEAVMEKAQGLDLMSQHLRRYADLVAQLAEATPESIRIAATRASMAAACPAGDFELFAAEDEADAAVLAR